MMDYLYLTNEKNLLKGSKMEEDLLWEPDMVLFYGSVDEPQDSAPINCGDLPSISKAEHGRYWTVC